MSTDAALDTRLDLAFRKVDSQGPASFPPQAALATRLGTLVDANRGGQIGVSPGTAALFCTAAVDVWHRAVHSFLISAAATAVSPIWASVIGYYSSHYSVRGVAHLLGFFKLHHKKSIALLDHSGGHFTCAFTGKGQSDGEHKFYWKVVRQHPLFANDPLYPLNEEDRPDSDAAHRNLGNYTDHVQRFPQFQPLNATHLKERVKFISQIEFTNPPIPQRDRFPDIEAVQIVAYHRLIRFRSFVDQILGNKNRFWTLHRTPAWVQGYLNFQLVSATGVGAYRAAP